MASGSTSRGGGSGAAQGRSQARAAQAPSTADAALLAPQLNPTFAAMPAVELVAHLNRHRRTDDFLDAAHVFAARERRLAEVEDLVRVHRLRDEIRAREYRDLEADAQIRRPQQGIAALISGISGHGGLAQQAAGQDREPVPQDFVAASDACLGFDDAIDVQTMVAEGEVGDDVPMKTRHGELMGNRAAPHLTAAQLPDTVIDNDERQAEQVATNGELTNRAARDLVAGLAAPLADTLMDDDERQVDVEQFATNVLSSNEEVQGDHEVSEVVLRARVTSGSHEVSQEEAHGENVATSSHKHPQAKQQATRATKKPCRKKRICFYNEVLHALKKKEEVIKKTESLAIAKEAASAKSKQLHCTCWWSEDSGDESQK